MLTKAYQRIRFTIIGCFGWLILRITVSTLKWHRIDPQDGWTEKVPHILTFWHGRQLLMPWFYLMDRPKVNRLPLVALISGHRDGRAVAIVMRLLGIKSVMGSSSRGGKKALFELIDVAHAQQHIAITPDGPKGPPQILKPGVIRIAQRSGSLIIPASIGIERKWVFKSWDSMIFPKPFSKVVMVSAPPIRVAERMTPEEFTQKMAEVSDQLNSVTKQCDEFDFSKWPS